MVKFVRGKIKSVGITVGVILLAVFIAQRFNLGGRIIESFKGVGGTVGESITGIFQGLLDGLIKGGQGLGESAVDLSEGFQQSVCETTGLCKKVFFEPDSQGTFVEGGSVKEFLTRIERNPQEIVGGVSRIDVEKGNIFKEITEILQQAGTTSRPESRNIQPRRGPFDLKNILTKATINNRIEAAKNQAKERPGQAFGGFKSATEQGAGLQATLARNKLLFPQFFK